MLANIIKMVDMCKGFAEKSSKMMTLFFSSVETLANGCYKSIHEMIIMRYRTSCRGRR